MEGTMTKNRVRVRATKELAQTEDIRHPDASYLADHRKLRLPDGTIHDFATGPLRYLGLYRNGRGSAVNTAVNEAKSKGWNIIWLDEVAPEPAPSLSVMPKAPALIIALSDHPVGHAPKELFDDLENGRYEGLNVIIVRDPKPGEQLTEPSSGRNIYFQSPKPASSPIPSFDNVTLAKTRIAFALRYANLYETGTDDATAMGAIAQDLGRLGTPEAAAIAAVARSAITPLGSGSNLAHELKGHDELFGTHLLQVISSASLSAKMVVSLRGAASTLEADLRIGLIG
jgi:hypothetical protein